MFLTMKNVEDENDKKYQKLSRKMVSRKGSDIDFDHALLVQRRRYLENMIHSKPEMRDPDGIPITKSEGSLLEIRDPWAPRTLFSRNELVLRFLSLVCLCFMFGLFLIQLDILWRSRESLVMEMLLRDSEQFYFHYPEFYDIAHNEETWCWDPDTLLLKVNTSFFMH